MMNQIPTVFLAVVITHISTPHLIVCTYKYSLVNFPLFMAIALSCKMDVALLIANGTGNMLLIHKVF